MNGVGAADFAAIAREICHADSSNPCKFAYQFAHQFANQFVQS